MIGALIALALTVALLPLVYALMTNLASRQGWWRLSRALAPLAPFVLGPKVGGSMAFHAAVSALREEGKLAEATALATARLAEPDFPAWSRNVAIDILISAGAYHAALGSEPAPQLPKNAQEALGLVLIQINLAEAEYNLGRWDAAEARLRPLDLAAWPFPICRAGLLQQRAWIAAHRGRPAEALELCAMMKPRWLPPIYQAEYHFTRAASLLGAGQIDKAEAALTEAEWLAKRSSTRRNALFMRARLAAARGDSVGAERYCREAASHPFRGQGGSELLLWVQVLRQLERSGEADAALRLVPQRDPESEAATTAAELLAV